MEIEIRRATIHDIDPIAKIIQLAFDDNVGIERVKQLLTLSHNYVFVAVEADSIVGFVENFLTVSQENNIRLELDLLAVHPDARGQGIGKKLIETSIDLAQTLGVYCLRALIATENGVMQKACKRMNLTQSPNEFSLFVKPVEQVLRPIIGISPAHLIRVETLTYKGIWLEGDITSTAIDNAHLIAIDNQCDILGAVVDKADTLIIDLLLESQFTQINDYHRWTFNSKND